MISPLIRLARPTDAVRIAEIYSESIAANDSTMVEGLVLADDMVDMLREQDAAKEIWVVDLDHRVVGWGRLRRYSQRQGYRFAAETSLFLSREHVGQGFGTVLQKKLMDRCSKLGFHHLVAKIFADNETSINLHTKLGYEMVGIQREIGFKQGRWQDVAIMG
ncbi:MAG: N-acetyltransferase family protein, partial [Rhodothermia bacterium]